MAPPSEHTSVHLEVVRRRHRFYNEAGWSRFYSVTLDVLYMRNLAYIGKYYICRRRRDGELKEEREREGWGKPETCVINLLLMDRNWCLFLHLFVRPDQQKSKTNISNDQTENNQRRLQRRRRPSDSANWTKSSFDDVIVFVRWNFFPIRSSGGSTWGREGPSPY